MNKPNRRTLADALGLTQQEVVVTVPPSDPAQAIPRSLDTWRSSVDLLIKERDEHKSRAEYLLNRVDVLQQTIERMTLEHDHSLQAIQHELDYWRRIAMAMIHANGEIRTTVNGMLKFGHLADDTLNRVAQLAEQIPQPVNQPVPINLTESTPEPIDLDGVRALAERLHGVQQQDI